MLYTWYQLLCIYLIYSFIGWCIEVSVAVISKKKFINRGFVSGPLCPIYGAGAVVFAVILPELKDNIFFLYLGGVILASFVELATGALLERIFHRKWWDYSKEKWNFDGYICLKFSLIWGLFAVLIINILNPIILYFLAKIPMVIGVSVVLVCAGLLLIDSLGTGIAILGLKKRDRISAITTEMRHASKILENAITRKIQSRMVKAFPAIEERVLVEKKEKEKFAEGCSFYKLFCIFLIGAFMGDIIETIYCLITTGILMSRSSVVYGPFSIVWGLACALLTALLYRHKDKNDRYIFTAGVVLGGAYEYVCSLFTELVFGTIFWDYSGFAFNLGGRINLLYCFFWGIAAVVWLKMIYPKLSDLIERIPVKAGNILIILFLIFMSFNAVVSSLALARYTQRNTEETVSHNEFLDFLDSRFTDERMERIYPNVKIVETDYSKYQMYGFSNMKGYDGQVYKGVNGVYGTQIPLDVSVFTIRDDKIIYADMIKQDFVVNLDTSNAFYMSNLDGSNQRLLVDDAYNPGFGMEKLAGDYLFYSTGMGEDNLLRFSWVNIVTMEKGKLDTNRINSIIGFDGTFVYYAGYDTEKEKNIVGKYRLENNKDKVLFTYPGVDEKGYISNLYYYGNTIYALTLTEEAQNYDMRTAEYEMITRSSGNGKKTGKLPISFTGSANYGFLFEGEQVYYAAGNEINTFLLTEAEVTKICDLQGSEYWGIPHFAPGDGYLYYEAIADIDIESGHNDYFYRVSIESGEKELLTSWFTP